MRHDGAPFSRRRLLRAAAIIPVSGVLMSAAGRSMAADTPHLDPSSSRAKALHYTHDASRSEVRSSDSEFCHNCANYSGGSGARWGPCQVFPGKLVNADGWCTAWARAS